MNNRIVKNLMVAGMIFAAMFARGASQVAVDSVASGDPWSVVTVNYTLSGVDADLYYKVAFDITANGIKKGVTNEAAKLESKAYTKVIDTAALFGAATPDPKAKVGVSLIAVKTQPQPPETLGGVQLWENGPYWAECNVGATKPEEYGYYFWWGDTVGYKREGGTWTNDAYYSGVTWVSSTGERMSSSPFNYRICPTYGKNNTALQSAGYIDSTGNLVAAHDAATAHCGAPWRMPTDAEMEALISNCDTTWTTQGGVFGRLVTGKGAYASKSIFLPAAGYGYDSNLYNTDSYGYNWSSTPYSGYSNIAWDLSFHSDDFRRYYYYRYYGQSVRPVRRFAK